MIRLAGKSDLKSIEMLESYFDHPYTHDIIKKDIDSNKIYVLIEGELVVGFVTISSVLDDGEIERIVVDQNFRRKGYGAKLIEFALSQLKLSGVNKVFLEVRADNAPALGLYVSCGFSKQYVRKKYYQDGCDAIVLSLSLEV